MGCWGGLGDLLRFILKSRFIVVIEEDGRAPRVMTHSTDILGADEALTSSLSARRRSRFKQYNLAFLDNRFRPCPAVTATYSSHPSPLTDIVSGSEVLRWALWSAGHFPLRGSWGSSLLVEIASRPRNQIPVQSGLYLAVTDALPYLWTILLETARFPCDLPPDAFPSLGEITILLPTDRDSSTSSADFAPPTRR